MKITFYGAVAALVLTGTTAIAQSFPEREMLGVVMWGAGGATDTVARAINPAAEDALGKPIVVLNKSGGGVRFQPPTLTPLLPMVTLSYTVLKTLNYTRSWALLILIILALRRSTFWAAAWRLS